MILDVIAFILSIVILFGVLIPIVLYCERKRIVRIDDFVRKAYTNNSVVTAYIGARRFLPWSERFFLYQSEKAVAIC